jgi:hypothetical protein
LAGYDKTGITVYFILTSHCCDWLAKYVMNTSNTFLAAMIISSIVLLHLSYYIWILFVVVCDLFELFLLLINCILQINSLKRSHTIAEKKPQTNHILSQKSSKERILLQKSSKRSQFITKKLTYLLARLRSDFVVIKIAVKPVLLIMLLWLINRQP